MLIFKGRPARIARALVAATLLVALLAPAGAQDISKYYTVQHPADFKLDWGAFYRQGNETTAAARKALPHHLDLKYGKDVKQKLDVYLPAGKKKTAAPVFVFFHGGGWREGDRAQYGYVAMPFAANGVITVVPSYRLTVDGFKYPDQPNDARAAVEWVYHNIARYGGDPQRIYIGGHSVGAILAADLGVDRAWLTRDGIPKDALRGFASISVGYDVRKLKTSDYAATPEVQEQASPILHIKDPAPLAIVSFGSLEALEQPSREFANKLVAAGVKTQFQSLAGQEHTGTALAIGDGQSELFQAVMQMINAPATFTSTGADALTDMWAWWNAAYKTPGAYTEAAFRRYFTEDASIVLNGKVSVKGVPAITAQFQKMQAGGGAVEIVLPFRESFVSGDKIFTYHFIRREHGGPMECLRVMGYGVTQNGKISLVNLTRVPEDASSASPEPACRP